MYPAQDFRGSHGSMRVLRVVVRYLVLARVERTQRLKRTTRRFQSELILAFDLLRFKSKRLVTVTVKQTEIAYVLDTKLNPPVDEVNVCIGAAAGMWGMNKIVKVIKIGTASGHTSR